MSQDLREALKEAQAVIAEQQQVLEELGSTPLSHATIVSITNNKATVARESGGLVTVARPSRLKKLKVGDAVLVLSDGNIFEAATAVLTGETAIVVNVGTDSADVTYNGNERAVFISVSIKDLAKGDKVLLDPSNRVIVHKFVQREKERFDSTIDLRVEWNDIGGQEEAKRQMIEAVELPLTHAKLFEFYKKKPVKGVLLYGPPGCGKTMLAKAAATSVTRLFNNKAPSGFMYVKGPELLDPYVGVTEATIRNLFHKAQVHKKEFGSPGIIFIDEADALLGRRGDNHHGLATTIVPMFLTEMNGLEESSALIILATNRPETLDPAITREGRIDRKVRVSRPTQKEAQDIFHLHMTGVPLAPGVNRKEAVQAAVTALYDTSRLFYVVTANRDEREFTLANLISGSVIAGVVEQAISLAMHRDLISNKKPQGVRMEDMLQAVENIYAQNRDVNHDDALIEFAAGKEITNIRRIHHVAKVA